MQPLKDDWDFSLAITAWKKLWLEACTNQERADHVWEPTKELLNRLARASPESITCFAGKYYMFPANSDGVAVNLFFLGAHNEVSYLGTLFDRTAYQMDKILEARRLKRINSPLADKLAKTRIGQIVRDAHFCKIAVDTNGLDTSVATMAVKRYLAVQSPSLERCAINWLPHQRGIELEESVRAQAERDAVISTKEDRLKAIAQDELEWW